MRDTADGVAPPRKRYDAAARLYDRGMNAVERAGGVASDLVVELLLFLSRSRRCSSSSPSASPSRGSRRSAAACS
jgi:hypothetical protein